MVLENIVVKTGDEFFFKKSTWKQVHRYWKKEKKRKEKKRGDYTLFLSLKLVLTQVSPSVLESFSLSFGTCIHCCCSYCSLIPCFTLSFGLPLQNAFFTACSCIVSLRPTLHKKLRPRFNSNQVFLLVQKLKSAPRAGLLH